MDKEKTRKDFQYFRFLYLVFVVRLVGSSFLFLCWIVSRFSPRTFTGSFLSVSFNVLLHSEKSLYKHNTLIKLECKFPQVHWFCVCDNNLKCE